MTAFVSTDIHLGIMKELSWHQILAARALLREGWSLSVISQSLDCLPRDLDVNLWRYLGDIKGRPMCDHPGCSKPARAKGLCDIHYRKLLIGNEPSILIQETILSALALWPEATTREISLAAGLSMNGAGNNLKRLLAAGLITRSSCATRRNPFTWSITECHETPIRSGKLSKPSEARSALKPSPTSSSETNATCEESSDAGLLKANSSSSALPILSSTSQSMARQTSRSKYAWTQAQNQFLLEHIDWQDTECIPLLSPLGPPRTASAIRDHRQALGLPRPPAGPSGGVYLRMMSAQQLEERAAWPAIHGDQHERDRRFQRALWKAQLAMIRNELRA